MSPRRPSGPSRPDPSSRSVKSQLRVIGGTLRGRTIPYNGDPGLRPMKDRVREAVFNLIGPRVVGKHVIDLFAGTGAMAIEALSRRAAQASLFEQKFPTARMIEETAVALGVDKRVQVSAGDTFVWAPRHSAPAGFPWLVFCCPPYALYVSRRADMKNLLSGLWNSAPAESLFVIESDERVNPATLLDDADWDVRQYPPAVIGIAEKPPTPQE